MILMKRSMRNMIHTISMRKRKDIHIKTKDIISMRNNMRNIMKRLRRRRSMSMGRRMNIKLLQGLLNIINNNMKLNLNITLKHHISKQANSQRKNSWHSNMFKT